MPERPIWERSFDRKGFVAIERDDGLPGRVRR